MAWIMTFLLAVGNAVPCVGEHMGYAGEPATELWVDAGPVQLWLTLED